jgi:preprotein translocase subunit YajC
MTQMLIDPLVAQASPGSGPLGFVPFILILAIIYFMVLRPQQQEQKQHQALLASLQKGDRVVTSSGLHGRIHEVGEKEITLEIADKVRVTIDRVSVKRRHEQKPGGKEE